MALEVFGVCRANTIIGKYNLGAKNISQKPWEKRAPVDRRSESDTRRTPCKSKAIDYKGAERRRRNDRRKEGERRDGWLRTNQWSSERVFDG